MTQTRKPAPQRRAELIDAVLVLLQDHPPGSLTTATIAAHVGLSQAALFRHFPTKATLWSAVMSEVETRAHAGWQAVEARAGTPIEGVRGLLDAQLTLIAATPAIPLLIFAPGRLAAESLTRPIHSRVMAAFRGRLANRIEAAVAAGEIDRGIRVDDAALLLIGLVQGIVLRWTLSDQAFDLRAEGNRLAALQLRLMGAPVERQTA